MSLPNLERAVGRAVARLGVVAALTAGASAVGTASADAQPPVPPPPPPGAPAAAAAGPPGAPPAPVGPPAPPAVPSGPWDGIAQCEAGGDWHADTGNDRHGGLQLDRRTWAVYGGGEFAPQGNLATREQQIVVGDRVRAEQGWDAWGSCADGGAPG